MTDSAMLGGVAEVVSSNPTVGHKFFFQHLPIVSIAQLVEVTDSAGLGGVAEVVSSNPTMGHKMFFKHFPA